MIENRRGLTIFSHTMLILGIIVILFPLYVAFVAATLDTKAVFDTPMTLIPGSHLFENMKTIWTQGVGANSAPFWLMMLNSFIMRSASPSAKSRCRCSPPSPSSGSVFRCATSSSG